MAHWFKKYIATPYKVNKFDCAHFVELVYKNEFNINLVLPQHKSKLDLLTASELILSYAAEKDFVKVDDPIEGDIVLIRRNGNLHLGIFFIFHDMKKVIHNLFNVGVVAEPARNFNILGFYRWKSHINQTH